MNDEIASYDAGKPRWYRRAWVIAPLAALIALALGYGAAASQDVRNTKEYRTVAAYRDATQEALEETQQSLDEARQSLDQAIGEKAQLELDKKKLEGDIPKRETAVKQAEAAVKKRERKVAARERAVLKREKVVGIVEKEIAANTVSDGIYEVGVDIKAGTYRKKGGSGCYYAILNSPDTSDIATNNLTDGPAIVTLSAGQYFDTTRCGDWVLQR